MKKQRIRDNALGYSGFARLQLHRLLISEAAAPEFIRVSAQAIQIVPTEIHRKFHQFSFAIYGNDQEKFHIIFK